MSVSRKPPTTIEGALEAMHARYVEMSASQRLLADFILQRPHRVAFASAAQIGTELGISPATVVRFGEFIGLRGYADLQRLAREGLNRQVSEVANFEVKTTALNGESLLQRNFRAEIQAIEHTAELLNEATFAKAVRLIAKARTIYIAGFRSNYGLSHHFAFNLALIGRRAVVLAPGVGDLPEQLLNMLPGDVCIVLTYKRYTSQIRDVVDHARATGVPVVTLTNPGASLLASGSDVLLPVAVKSPSILESRVAALSVLNALITALALGSRKATSESLKRHEVLWARLGTYLEEGTGGAEGRTGRAHDVRRRQAETARPGATGGGAPRQDKRRGRTGG